MTDGNEKQIKQLLQHAEAQLLQAEFAPPVARDAIWHDIKDALIRAEKIAPGSGAWLMACVHGRQNNAEMCRKWLDRAVKYDSLPDKEAVQSNPHLKPFREEDWFRQFTG
jgi:hypothetical protein